jgi:hypothetical protein
VNIDLVLVTESLDDGPIRRTELGKLLAMRRISTLTDTTISDFVRYKFLLDQQKPEDNIPTTGMTVGGYYECDRKLDLEKLLSSGKKKLWIQIPALTFDANGREVIILALAALEPDNEPRLLTDYDVLSDLLNTSIRQSDMATPPPANSNNEARTGQNLMRGNDNYAPFTDSWFPLASTASTSRQLPINLFPIH